MEDMKFNSFRKVARSLGYDENGISIVSFHWGGTLEYVAEGEATC